MKEKYVKKYKLLIVILFMVIFIVTSFNYEVKAATFYDSYQEAVYETWLEELCGGNWHVLEELGYYSKEDIPNQVLEDGETYTFEGAVSYPDMYSITVTRRGDKYYANTQMVAENSGTIVSHGVMTWSEFLGSIDNELGTNLQATYGSQDWTGNSRVFHNVLGRNNRKYNITITCSEEYDSMAETYWTRYTYTYVDVGSASAIAGSTRNSTTSRKYIGRFRLFSTWKYYK